MERECRILSFKNELLSQHVYLMMRYYEELFGSRWAEISSLRCGIEPSILDRAAKVAIVFHDFGKVAYQSRIRSGRGSRYHEYFSVAYMDYIRDSLISWLGTKETYLAVVWSILVHHLSMREPIDSRDFLMARLSSCNVSPVYTLSESEALCLASVIDKHLGNSLSMAAKNISKINALDSVDIISKAKSRLGRMYGLALRLSRVLVVSDNLAASSRESGRLRVFLKDIASRKSIDNAREAIKAWLER